MANGLELEVGATNTGSERVVLPQSKTLSSHERNNPSKPWKTLAELIGRFSQLRNAEGNWRTNRNKWFRYYDGQQLTSSEIFELNARKQPSIVINKIAPRVDLVVGLMNDSRYRLKAFPRNTSEQDLKSTEAVNAALRFIEEHNQQKFVESEVFEDGLIGGRAFFEVTTAMDSDLDLDILVKYRDGDDIFVDPASVRYDLSDARDVADSIFVNKDDLMAIYPDFESEINMAMSDMGAAHIATTKHAGDNYLYGLLNDDKVRSSFVDKNNGRIRVTKYWFRTRELRKFVHIGGKVERIPVGASEKEINRLKREIEKASGEKPEIMELMADVVRVQTFIGTAILEQNEPEFLNDMFPYVPYVVKREKSTNLPYGLVRPMVDPQDEINKRRSKALHALNTERMIYEEGAIDDEEVVKREVAKPDGIIKKNRGFEFRIDSNRELGSSQLQLYQAANVELDSVTGVTPDLMGSVTNARSQNAIEQRQRQGLAVLNRAFENWKRSKILLEKLKLKFVQEFWDGPKILNVTDSEGKVSQFPINLTYRDEAGDVKKMNDVTTGKYDIVFEESSESVNFMEEVFLELTKLAQTGQIDPELIFEFAPLPKEIRDRMLSRQKQLKEEQQKQELLKAEVEAQGANVETQPNPLG